MFLTPGIRGARAKSLLTTRASKNLPTTGSPEGDSIDREETDGERFSAILAHHNASSSKKYRSNTKSRHSNLNPRLVAPSSFHNCADCGSFYVSVSVSSCLDNSFLLLKETISAIKPRQYCFRAEILPA